jgi:hypothetical protein
VRSTSKPRPARRWHGALAAGALALLAGSGCSQAPPTAPAASAAGCRSPVRGHRYALCGHVSTAGIALGSGPRAVVGAVDARPGAANGASYAVQGGSFHASH